MNLNEKDILNSKRAERKIDCNYQFRKILRVISEENSEWYTNKRKAVGGTVCMDQKMESLSQL